MAERHRGDSPLQETGEKTPTEKCIQMLRDQVGVAQSKKEMLCVRTHGQTPGEATSSPDNIIGKTDDEIVEWMRDMQINPAQVFQKSDLFWHQ